MLDRFVTLATMTLVVCCNWSGRDIIPAAPACGARRANPVSWQTVQRGPITLTLSRSVPPAEVQALLAARLLAHRRLVTLLDLDPEHAVTIRLSPSREAARAVGFGMGVALSAHDRIEAVLPPGDDTFERRRPGYLLSKLLLRQGPRPLERLLLLERGLPEAIDSPAGVDGSFLTRGVDLDLEDPDPGVAASFLRFLIDRHGWKALAQLLDEPVSAMNTADRLDRALRRVTGRTMVDTVRDWKVELARKTPTIEPVDRRSIEKLVRNLDLAEAQGDRARYRAQMDTFYCDVWSEGARGDIARTVVGRDQSPVSRLVEVHAKGVRNYPEAHLVLERREGAEARLVEIWVEHFPEGWRMTFSSDWDFQAASVSKELALR